MKKMLSGVLAAGMIASMGVSAFAAEKADHNLGLKLGSTGDVALQFSDDMAYAYETNGELGMIPYGETFYYALYTNGNIGDYSYDLDGNYVGSASSATPAGSITVNNDSEPTGQVESTLAYDYDYIRSISIRSEWEEGKELVESVDIVKKKLVDEAESAADIGDRFALESDRDITLNADSNGDAMGEFADMDDELDWELLDVEAVAGDTDGMEKYYYFLAVTTKHQPTETDVSDLIGTIELRGTSEDTGVEGEEIEVDVNVELMYEENDDITVMNDETVLYFGDGDTEEWIDFEDHEYDYFVVDTCDQDELVAKVTDTFNHDIGDLYPSANLHFFNGNYATFNRTGELTLTGCGMFSDIEDKWLYAVDQDGEISLVADSDSDMYDEYEEAFKIKTRTLGVYFISDEELDLVEDVVVETTPDEDAKENPTTGAKA